MHFWIFYCFCRSFNNFQVKMNIYFWLFCSQTLAVAHITSWVLVKCKQSKIKHFESINKFYMVVCRKVIKYPIDVIRIVKRRFVELLSVISSYSLLFLPIFILISIFFMDRMKLNSTFCLFYCIIQKQNYQFIHLLQRVHKLHKTVFRINLSLENYQNVIRPMQIYTEN